jgi:hypothetical protein
MDPVILRALERILAVVIGGVCVYLGYRLFLHIPEQKEGEGKINLPGDVSIYVTRVGPGVFFALFGTGIVALALYHGITYAGPDRFSENASVQDNVSPDSSMRYSGLMPRDAADAREQLAQNRLELRLDIEFLNTLPTLLQTDLSPVQRREVGTRLASAKLALLRTVWGADWGDYDAFLLWAESGAHDPIPEGLDRVAAYYRTGQEGSP